MINVTCEVKTYNEPPKCNARVKSHWSYPRLVVIELPGGEQIEVIAEEMIQAIRNAVNTARY